MCWHHVILGDFKTPCKVEIKFKDPAGTGFDVLVIGPLPSAEAQTRISAVYKAAPQLKIFRGGVKDVLFHATEADAGITHTYSYTMTPMGCCMVQKNIKDGLSALGVTNFLTVQKDYNQYVRADPANAETILRDRGHID